MRALKHIRLLQPSKICNNYSYVYAIHNATYLIYDTVTINFVYIIF